MESLSCPQKCALQDVLVLGLSAIPGAGPHTSQASPAGSEGCGQVSTAWPLGTLTSLISQAAVVCESIICNPPWALALN